MKLTLHINGKVHHLDLDPNMPLLWALRDHLGLTGTKFSCGAGLCGSCNVLVDGKAVRSCQYPLEAAQGAKIVTIEGLSGTLAEALFEAWSEEEVAQCGYCQPGQVIQAYALLSQNPRPSEEEWRAHQSQNLCRCGSYPRIAKAIQKVIREGKP